MSKHIEAQDLSFKAVPGEAETHLETNNIILDPFQNTNLLMPEDHKAGRIWTSIGFSLLYGAAFWGIGTTAIFLGMDAASTDNESYEKDYSSNAGASAAGFSFGAILLAGALVAPAFAVHTAHSIWGGEGSLSWTYFGSILGTVGGAAVGSLAFLGGTECGLIVTPVLGLIGGTVGAILAYEMSNTSNRKDKFNGIASFYPVIDVSAKRTTIGIGMTF